MNYSTRKQAYESTSLKDGTYSMFSVGTTILYTNGYQASFELEGIKLSSRQYDSLVTGLSNTYDIIPDIGVYNGTVEISFHFEDIDTAITFGLMFGQYSIWDFEANQEIVLIDTLFR